MMTRTPLYVYLAEHPLKTEMKIGVSANPKLRCRAHVGFRLSLVMHGDYCIESQLLSKFRKLKTRGAEWFKYSSLIRREFLRLGAKRPIELLNSVPRSPGRYSLSIRIQPSLIARCRKHAKDAGTTVTGIVERGMKAVLEGKA